MNRTITIKGIGKLSLKPDQVVITLTLETIHANYDRAMDEAAKRLEWLRGALMGIGFAKDALKTTSFNVRVENRNERAKNGYLKLIFVGYRVTHGLKLEFDFDSGRLSKVLGTIAVCIVEPRLNVQFTVKDLEAVNAALLESACANARSKAEVLTWASGVTLGELVSIDYNWGELPLYSHTRYAIDSSIMVKASAAPTAMNIEPDDIDVSDSATFVWEIR